MSTGTERFLHGLFAIKAVNRGVLGWNSLQYFAKNLGIVFHPINKQTPRRITNRFRQMMIANHVPHLQVFIGNEVARHHQRTCSVSQPSLYAADLLSDVVAPDD